MELSELYSSASSESVNSVVLSVCPGSAPVSLPTATGQALGSGSQRRHLQNGGVSNQLAPHAVVHHNNDDDDDDDGLSSSDDDMLHGDDDVEMQRQGELLNTTSSSSSSEDDVIV